MSYISEIFDRLDIQHIREFLLYGVECVEVNPKSYKERIDESSRAAIDFVRTKFLDRKECEEITTMIYDYATTCQDVYMEIGLQCGFRLAVQMMEQTKEAHGENDCKI